MPNNKRLLIFASGNSDGGGSGFANLAKSWRSGFLRAEIAGVVSNHRYGGVWRHARDWEIPFEFFPGPYDAYCYRELVLRFQATQVALIGWLKLVQGLNPAWTFNVHPAPLPIFGGPGMHGHRLHQAVLDAFRCGAIKHSAVCFHFVTDQLDAGPVFCAAPVTVMPEYDAVELERRTKSVEHWLQPFVTNAVVDGMVSWDGRNPESLRVPKGYLTKLE